METSEPIDPWVTKPPGKPYYVARWLDPNTGAVRQRSTRLKRRREAERFADDLAKELAAKATAAGAAGPLATGEYRPEKKSESTRWQLFCDRYEREWMSENRPRSGKEWSIARRHVERLIAPVHPEDLTSSQLSTFRARLLEENSRGPQTVDKILRTVMAALRWGADIGVIDAAPTLPRRRRGQKRGDMKGRPLVAEEFDRMITAVPKVITNPDHVEGWRELLRHAWLGGMRLSELVATTWDDRSRPSLVDIDDPRPLLRIPAEYDKGGETRLLPIAPEWANHLKKAPKRKRNGFLVDLCGPRGVTRNPSQVSRKVCSIGEKAGVIVSPGPKIKYASLHDLRRSFGDRWAARVMPPVLQLLMRHEDIKTTMRFYVGRESQRLSSSVWEWHDQHVATQRDPSRDPGTKRRRSKSGQSA